jgi:anti-sigma regulatory factor (Ser/Thr protein kinase)
MPATFHQVIGNDFTELKNLMDAATAFLEEQGVDAAAVFRINLTLEEIVTNIIKFGHDDDDLHPIDIAVKVDAEIVEAVIIDEGHAFNPVEHQRTEPAEALMERTTGGLGIYLVKKLLSGMHYRREGQRNIVEVKSQRRKAPTAA